MTLGHYPARCTSEGGEVEGGDAFAPVGELAGDEAFAGVEALGDCVAGS